MQYSFASEKQLSLCSAAFNVGVVHSNGPYSESLLMNTIMNNSQDTIYAKDLHSRYILNSKAHARQFGLEDPLEMLGKSDLDYFPEDFALRAFLEEQEIIRTGIPLIGHIEKLEIANAKNVWYSASKYPLRDENGAIIGTWGTSINITSIKQTEEALAAANEELKKLSRIDELSGLYNRRHFYETLNTSIKRRDHSLSCGITDTFCLIALDIDHFKAVNDNHGHANGDEAIRHIGNILSANCRSSDTVFRIGGDEYVILLLNTGLSAAKLQSERIRRAVETTPLMLSGTSYRLTVSLGVSCFDDHNDPDEFVREADNRLYHSKRHGRNCVT